MLDRTLAWDGCLNARDLGGHPTEDGGETRPGRIVRADSVRKLSDGGWRELVGYGIATIVDLRFHSELDADPPGDLPVEVVHVPLLGDPEPPPEYWLGLDALGGAAPTIADGTRLVYLDFLERFRPRFGDAIRAVADAPPGGVLVHCAVGKDRTGLVTALLLRLAGVPIGEIAVDYSLSADNLRPLLDAYLEEAPDEDERRRRERLGATPADAMRGVLAELDAAHGGVRGYLGDAGLDEAVLDRARTRLRG